MNSINLIKDLSMTQGKSNESHKPTLQSLVGKHCVFREHTNVLNVVRVSEVTLFEHPNPNGNRYGVNGEYNVKFLGLARLEVQIENGTLESLYDLSGYANIEDGKFSIIDVSKR